MSEMQTVIQTPTTSSLIVYLLAAWYTQYCLRWLRGPFGVFEWLRLNVARVRLTGAGEMEVLEDTFFSQIWTCVYCFSFWAGMLLLPAYLFLPVVLLPLAAGGGISLLEGVMRKLWR